MNPILLLPVNYEGSFLIDAHLEMTIHHISQSFNITDPLGFNAGLQSSSSAEILDPNKDSACCGVLVMI